MKNLYIDSTEKIEKFMKANLSEKRYIHSIGVSKMAFILAKIHGADENKAYIAGKYHDIAKCFTDELLNRYIREYGIDEKFYNNNPLAHSKVAAAILMYEFSICDEDVLNAVRSHTTGRVGMSLLEEVVYVADAIEENRNYPELSALQEKARHDLDGACLDIMNFAIQFLKEKGRIIDEDTIMAKDFIEHKIKNASK